jgi:hypothetical protein
LVDVFPNPTNALRAGVVAPSEKDVDGKEEVARVFVVEPAIFFL